MKKLYLLRHARTQSNGPSDFERELTDQGAEQARAVGRFLAERGAKIDAVVSSSAVRAATTARLAAAELGIVDVELRRDLYSADTHAFLDIVKSLCADTVLMVGHNPTISDVACLLGNLAMGLSPAGLVELSFEVDWEHVGVNTATEAHVFDPVPTVT